jgi:Uma2 family endonuclease
MSAIITSSVTRDKRGAVALGNGVAAPPVHRAEQRLRLSAIPWDAYVQLGNALMNRHICITYDRGEMELMTLSSEHENRKKRVARLIEAMTEEMEIDIASCGSMTFQRQDLQKGLEGDECYWIKNEALVRDRLEIDPEVDPPPDLAVEIDLSRSSLNRMDIYAALRVPEVWRWDGDTLRVYLLTRKAKYKESARSKAFPFLPLAEFAKFVTKTGISETQLVRSFRAWIRQQVAGGWK